MQLNPAEISELIKSRIEGLVVSADIRNEGTVVSVTDGICRVHGLSRRCRARCSSSRPRPTARRPTA
jgi:F0F1-type ATP synthase alpha subunit